MDFNEKTVVFFKPQGLPVNILIAGKHLPLLAYFSLEEPKFIKNYFKAVLPCSQIESYIRKVDNYALLETETVKDTLIAFLLYARDRQKDVIISIPIFNYDRKNINGTIVSFGNFIAINKEDFTDESLYQFLPLTISDILINNIKVTTPCELCKLKNERIGEICIYKVTSYECLFNCEVEVKSPKEEKLDKKFVSSDLQVLETFWETPEGKDLSNIL